MGYRQIPENRILRFRATPGFKGWKRFFTDTSIAHPAKMNLFLLRWILKKYTNQGDQILDPMAGTGSTGIIAAIMGRHSVCVEYEPVFFEMIEANIELARTQSTFTKPRGIMSCMLGDARKLSELLDSDIVITSPPYSMSKTETGGEKGRRGGDPRLRVKKDYAEISEENIGRLPPGDIDSVVLSPPYGEAQSGGGIVVKGYDGPKHSPTDLLGKRSYTPDKFGENNISRLRYGESVDAVITSPPYGNRLADGVIDDGDDARMSYMQAINAVIVSPPFGDSIPAQDEKWIEEHRDDESSSPNHKTMRFGRSMKGYPVVDTVIISPPYSDSNIGGDDDERRTARMTEAMERGETFHRRNVNWVNARMKGTKQGICFDQKRNYSKDPGNIGNMPHGNIDSVVTSPPSSKDVEPHSFRPGHIQEVRGYSDDPENIGKKSHGEIDVVVTSQPYEGGPFDHAGGHGGSYAAGIAERDAKMKPVAMTQENIGILKGQTYLEAMLQVYHECWKSLKPGGKMILVVKNFIRDMTVVRLDLDTIKLCELAGFILIDHWYFRIPKQSFWRILYHKKYPDVPEILHEDILILAKPAS